MIEITSILATILQNARLAQASDHPFFPVARISLHPKGGHASEGMGGMPLRVWVE
jgi:hypothetical protein